MPHENMQKIVKTLEKLHDLQSENFWAHVLFAYQWWLLIVMMVVLWSIWIILVDRTRLHIILLAGFIASMLALVMDDIGVSEAMWIYPYPIGSFTNRLNTVDMAIIPVFYMLLYQYMRRWGPYLITLVVLTLFAIFVAEPLFGELYMYIRIDWKYWYSGPIYAAMGIFVKLVVDKLEKNALKYLPGKR